MLQGALTPLALGPQGPELALQGIDCAHRPQVRLAFLRGAGMHDVWQACKDDDRPGLHDPKDAKPQSAPYSSLPAIAHCRHEPGAGKKAAALQGPAPCWAGALAATGWHPRLDPATMCVPQLTLCWQCSHRVASPAASGDLQDMHISRTLANFMMPPMARLGVLMVMLRVWSPAPHKTSTQDAELAVPLVLPPPCSACTEAKSCCSMQLQAPQHRPPIVPVPPFKQPQHVQQPRRCLAGHTLGLTAADKPPASAPCSRSLGLRMMGSKMRMRGCSRWWSR